MRRQPLARLFVLLAGALAVAGVLAQPVVTPEIDALVAKAESHGAVPVIIGVALDRPFSPEGRLAVAGEVMAQRTQIAGAQQRAGLAIDAAGGRTHTHFGYIPYVGAMVTAEALRRLLDSPDIASIHEDQAVEPFLSSSAPYINANRAWSVGLDGSGKTIAILDTGVDKTHPFLTGKVVSEACYSFYNQIPGLIVTPKIFSVCPEGFSVRESTATGSAVPCTYAGCDHGTHVAGIAAGKNGPGGMNGVAKEATVIAIQVFSYNQTEDKIKAQDTDVIKGLNRVYALRNTYNIAAVNLSLGGGRYYSACDSNPIKAAIDNLRSVGIATVIATGNAGYKDSINYPACVSTAVSVGSTNPGAVSGFSNISSAVTLVAPGSSIYSSIPGTGYSSESGTSMAAPHVAGAWGLLKEYSPSISVSDAVTLFRSGAVSVNDTRSGGTVTGLKRLDLGFLGPQLSVTRAGSGFGSVTSVPAGVSCGSTCAASFYPGAAVFLTPTPVTGATFAGWSGACVGTGVPCALSMQTAKSVVATFDAIGPLLTVQIVGAGTVTSTQPGINCGSACQAFYAAGTVVALNAAPGPGLSFIGWGGACTGSGSCSVTMGEATNVTAIFGVPPAALNNGTPAADLFAGSGARTYHYVDVPPGAVGLTVQTSEGSGDVDLYVRRGTLPTAFDYDCRPYLTGNAETCTFDVPPAGRYYVMLSAFSAYSGVTLSASYTLGSYSVQAPGAVTIASGTNASPTIVTTLTMICPASGLVLLTGSGESSALSTYAGNAFIGLAYSIARDSTATDNANVVQSSALARFNGDANRDFLKVQRADSCTPGAASTYRLTAYRTTTDTSAASFLWNGRLTATEPRSAANAGFAPGTTILSSSSSTAPTIVTTLTATCPSSGRLLVGAAGESAAISTKPGAAFIGLAYSIARDGTATDNSNVVQSSALGFFDGDVNRDFLNVQRVDSCAPGTSYTYRLTAYRTTPDTGANSFVWNGRLVASDPASAAASGLAAGGTAIASASNAAPTVVTTLDVTCPAGGGLLVTGSGESASLSTNPGTAFVGLAYSVARDSTATDNTNVVQSSALAVFSGDVNRDFLNVQRVDSCTPGALSTYRLTAYRTTADTGASSFVWNGRLAAVAMP